MEFYRAITPMVVPMGDFNMAPNKLALWNATWLEADDPLWRATHDSEGKIDYIYIPDAQCRPRLGEIHATNVSDHHRYYGFPKSAPC